MASNQGMPDSIFTGSIDEIRRESTACNCKRNGRNGEDIYSLAVGLEKVLNNPTGEYRRILICRPNAQFDQDIGFLPGDEQERYHL